MASTGRVAVVGGSLGGLTAGLLLRDLGFDVTIYERSEVELEQRGAGIGFLPASYRYLIERGSCSLDEISTSPTASSYLDRSGAITHDEAHTYRFSSWNTVYRRLLACFRSGSLPARPRGRGLRPTADTVDLRLNAGRTDSVDLLVCADGISSRSRQALQPGVAPAYSGYVAWRGMVPEGALSSATVAVLGDAITYFVYANSHILVYPIPGLDGSVEIGERLINFVWYRNYLPGGDLSDVLTDVAGEHRTTSLPPGVARPEHVAELRATAAARLPAVMAEVVCATEEPFLQVVFDVELDQMAFGRVCLLGDAAWVARPHAAAGTAKAAADAWALADALGELGDVEAALAVWEPGQMRLGRQLVERTRRMGQRSQTEGTWTPGDPEFIFGLFRPGE